MKNFTTDYSFNKDINCDIDMVLSGKYLAERKFELDLTNIKIDEYPNETRINLLKSIIAKKFAKDSNNFVIGAAGNGVIQNLVKLFFANGGTLLTTEFSFSQPGYAVTRLGGKIIRAKHNNDFTISFENIINNITSETKAVFICNPNNSTGFYYDPKFIISFAKKK